MAPKPKRISAAAAGIPADKEAADRLLGEIGTIQRKIDRIDLDLSEQVAALKKVASEQAAPLAAEIKAKVAALAAFAAQRRDEIIPAGRKSVALSQGVIGFRWGNPTVKVSKGQEDAVITTFQRLGLTDLLREIVEIDREAILRSPARIEGLAGISVEQTETFYAKPLDVQSEATVTSTKVTDPARIQAADAA